MILTIVIMEDCIICIMYLTVFSLLGVLLGAKKPVFFYYLVG